MMANPITFSGASTSVRRMPPGLGEHSAEILEELGYSSDDTADIMKFTD